MYNLVGTRIFKQGSSKAKDNFRTTSLNSVYVRLAPFTRPLEICTESLLQSYLFTKYCILYHVIPHVHALDQRSFVIALSLLLVLSLSSLPLLSLN